MGWQSDGFVGDEHGQQNAWYESDEAYDEQRREGAHGDRGDTPIHAVAAREYFDRALADFDEPSLDTIIVPGSGISMGEPLMRRRERPLTLRIAVLALIACILVTGIFAVTPLGADKASAESPFQVLASSMVLNRQPGYFYYTAEPGDTLDAVARRFHVQVGGIYKKEARKPLGLSQGMNGPLALQTVLSCAILSTWTINTSSTVYTWWSTTSSGVPSGGGRCLSARFAPAWNRSFARWRQRTSGQSSN